MEKKLKVHQILSANMSMEKLISQELNYPVYISYNLSKIKKELNDSEKYILERLNSVLGNINFKEMTNEQYILYQTVMDSDIIIDIPSVLCNDVFEQDGVKLSIKDVNNLECVLCKKN